MAGVGIPILYRTGVSPSGVLQYPAPAAVNPNAPATPQGRSVYWVGNDGNVWFKNDQGVSNAGKAIRTGDGGFDTDSLSAEATRIDDPNPRGGAIAPQDPNGNRSAAEKPDKTNDINLNQAGLGSVDTQTAAGLSAIDKALGTLNGQYDEETGANNKTYQTNSDTNQGNLQKNKQSSFINAAQGRQGLFGTLSSLGALNGSGIELANNAVKHGADLDLSSAADNYATNQSGLDTAIETYRREDKSRRENAELQAGNAKTNVNNDAARSKQNFYKNIANDYDLMGNAGGAKDYSDRAAALYPQVAATNVPNANLGYSAAAFNSPSLASYIAGAGGTQVSASAANPSGPAGQLPGLSASESKKKQPTALV